MTQLTAEDAVSYRVKMIEGHKCNLNFESDTVALFVKSGVFIPLRRFFRKSFMISTRDPRTKAYAKSLQILINEEKKHLERYFFMIHPFSDFNFIWQSIMTIVHLTIYFFIPIYYLNQVDESVAYNTVFSLVLSSACLINVPISFLIGFYDRIENKVVLKPKKVIIRYLNTHFLFDVASSLNYNLIGHFTGLFEPIWFSRFQWMLKINRLFTINEYMDNVQSRVNIPNYMYRILKYNVLGVVVLLWLNFSLYSLDLYYNRQINLLDLSNKFFLVANKSYQALFQCSIFKEYYEVIHHVDLYLAVASLHCGKFFEIWILAQIFQAFASYMIVARKYQTMLHQVEAFTRFKDLPKRICRRIYSYLNFRSQSSIYNEKILIDNLCGTIKNEILWNKCQNLVTKVQTFALLPSPIMMKLSTKLKSEIYLPNDVVIQIGEVGNEMFFVYVGVLAVFTESGKEICHLSDGSHFGEIALLLNETRVASVVAIDFCELYRLTKKDFHEAIEPYPSVRETILKAARDRWRETKFITQR